MKNLFLTLSLFLFSCSTFAQIALERTYGESNSMYVTKLEIEGYKYFGVDTTTTHLNIYNTNHSLWKSLTLPVIAGSKVNITPTFLSENLFNSDNSIEYIIGYQSGTGATSAWTMYLVNEAGTILYTFNNGLSGKPVKVGTGWKLQTSDYYTNPAGSLRSATSYYSLPGQYTTGLAVAPQGGSSTGSELVPNPIESSGVLKYNLPSGINQAQVTVYSTTGAEVRNYNITNQFSEIIIEKGILSPGIYLYSISYPGYISEMKKFVVE